MTSTAVIGFAEQATNGLTLADSMATAAQNNTQSFEFYTATGEVFATVTGIWKILSPISIQANTLAATLTFLKIEMDVKNGKGVDPSDVLTLGGNVLGAVGKVFVLAGFATGASETILTGVGIAAGVASVFTSGNLDSLKAWVQPMIAAHFGYLPVPDLSNMYLAGGVSTGGFTVFTYDQVIEEDIPFTGLRIYSNGQPPQQIVDGVPVPPPPPGDPDCDGDGTDC